MDLVRVHLQGHRVQLGRFQSFHNWRNRERSTRKRCDTQKLAAVSSSDHPHSKGMERNEQGPGRVEATLRGCNGWGNLEVF